MTQEEQFITAIKDNMTPEKAGFPAVVQGVVVEAGDTFCRVRLTHNDLEIDEVMYTATEDNNKGLILKPKQGTNVLTGTVGDNENSLYIVGMDEVEQVKLTIDKEVITFDKTGLHVELSEGKITAKNREADLKALLTDLVDMVTQLTVSTGVGPSGTPLPPTVMQGNEVKETIEKLFK